MMGHILQENVLGQKFVIDLTMSVDLRKAGETDDLNHTVNYAEVFRCASCGSAQVL
jgi:dihydroneopterin aldolase